MGHNSQNKDKSPQIQTNTSLYKCTSSKLKLLSINACGLKNNFPEFIDLINSHDVIGVQETKLDDSDQIDIPGYTIICQNRCSLSRYRSGGTALIVKNSVFPYIKPGKSNSKLIQWFSISNEITNTKDNILCGIVYIPPIGSKYASEDPYLELQHEFDNYCSRSENIVLFGDFNSRTANLPDYVTADEFVLEMCNGNTIFEENMHGFAKM